MVEEFENKINEVLLENIAIEAKKEKIKQMIEELSGERMKKSFLHAYNNYQWTIDDKGSLPEFRLTDIEYLSADEHCSLPGWAKDLYDDELYKTSIILIENTQAAIIHYGNYSHDLHFKIFMDAHKENNITNSYRVGDDDNYRLYNYTINHTPGKVFDITIIEERHLSDNISKFINKFYAIPEDDIIVVHHQSLDEHDLESVQSDYIYKDHNRVSEEWCKNEKNEKPYIFNEIEFVCDLGLVNVNSPVFKRAVTNSLGYSYGEYGSFYSFFCFEIKQNDFDFWYQVRDNDSSSVYIHGNNKDVSVVAHLSEEKLVDDLSYEELLEIIENNDAKQKVEEVINRLEELGVKISFQKPKKR